MRREEEEDEDEDPPIPVQVLKYVDFTPRLDIEDDSNRFKKLDIVLERVNREIQEGRVDKKLGEIITIETLYYPVANSDWKIEEKTSINLFPSRCISIIRIFYTEASEEVTSYPEIGIKDFIPKQISGGGFFKRPVFEDFSAVLSTASDWITANPECEFKNAQCLEVKMRWGRIDSRVMSHNADRGDYIRIFRVSYIKKNALDLNGGENGQEQTPIFLSTIIFTPADKDATVQEIRRKIHEWVVFATRGNFSPVSYLFLIFCFLSVPASLFDFLIFFDFF